MPIIFSPREWFCVWCWCLLLFIPMVRDTIMHMNVGILKWPIYCNLLRYENLCCFVPYCISLVVLKDGLGVCFSVYATFVVVLLSGMLKASWWFLLVCKLSIILCIRWCLLYKPEFEIKWWDVEEGDRWVCPTIWIQILTAFIHIDKIYASYTSIIP